MEVDRGRCQVWKRDTFHVLRMSFIDILYTLDIAHLLVKLKPRIFQRLPPFE
jgi:hypothetical protein